jgi:CRISPR-associated endoribonuclease Cas6
MAEVTVAFTSPTYFSQNGTDTVQPDPRLIAGSWRRRWNTSLPDESPLAISDEDWSATHRLLTLAAFDLRTEHRDTGHNRDRAGFTGSAALRLARNAPAPARMLLATLARFSEYCGTGAQVTHGFGATTLTTPSA